MTSRVEDGVVYTPPALADLAASQLHSYARACGVYGKPVWDPCCGKGALIDAAHRAGFRRAGGADLAAGSDLFDDARVRPLVICNPPYVGGTNLRRIVGESRYAWLKATYTAEKTGSCDLAGYVLRHVLQANRPLVSTWIVTNTIAQGSTRRIGLRWALQEGGYRIVAALKDITWPGVATVTVHVITIVAADLPQVGVTYAPHYKL